MTPISTRIAAAICLALTTGAAAQSTFVPVTDAMLANPDPADWLMWRRTSDSWGYSPLDAIHRRNVGRLALAWSIDLDAKFFMWMPEIDTGPRPIEDGSDWLSLRDPDGSIRADLDELGMLDDGVISNRDASRLLEKRLTDAGLDVTLDEYPGAHTTPDKALELVGYMQSALDV